MATLSAKAPNRMTRGERICYRVIAWCLFVLTVAWGLEWVSLQEALSRYVEEFAAEHENGRPRRSVGVVYSILVAAGPVGATIALAGVVWTRRLLFISIALISWKILTSIARVILEYQYFSLQFDDVTWRDSYPYILSASSDVAPFLLIVLGLSVLRGPLAKTTYRPNSSAAMATVCIAVLIGLALKEIVFNVDGAWKVVWIGRLPRGTVLFGLIWTASLLVAALVAWIPIVRQVFLMATATIGTYYWWREAQSSSTNIDGAARLAGVTAIIVLIAGVARYRAYSRSIPEHCVYCGYRRDFTPDRRCPECGAEIAVT